MSIPVLSLSDVCGCPAVSIITLGIVTLQAPLPLVAIVGPTACGKTRLALDLARHLPAALVNCDSLQFYRGLDIGTAKTPLSERGEVPHHLFDILEPHEEFSAGDFAGMARRVVAEVSGQRLVPFLVGGTGFYLRALLDGLAAGPKRDEDLRTRLAHRERRKPGSLHRILSRFDRETAARIHPNDLNKAIRALEICLLTRRPAVEIFRQGRVRLEGYSPLKIGLDPPRPLLHQRIESRTRGMFAKGLTDEVRNLLAGGVRPDAKAIDSIGYRQVVDYLGGRLKLDQAIEETIVATRQYAKRQLTWFRRESGLVWISDFGDSPDARVVAARLINEHLDRCGWPV